MQNQNPFINQYLLANASANNSQSNTRPILYQNNLSLPLNNLSLNIPGSFSQPASTQADLYNTLLMWKLHNNLQTQLLQSQLLQRFEGNPAITNDLDQVSLLKNEPKRQNDDDSLIKNEHSENQFLPELCDPNKSIKAHLKDIIYFIIDKFGITDDQIFRVEKLKYRNHKDLTLIYDALLSKYASASKTKEEMSKYVFRKALKFMKQKLKAEGTKNAQDTGSSQKRKFKTFIDEMYCKIEDDGEDIENQRTVAVPKSKNKPTSFSAEVIAEAFSSPDFQQGFEEYLKRLDGTLELDNNKKMDKFIRFIEGALKRDIIKDIKKYKRIPWLKIWSENTKRVAYDLLVANQNGGPNENRKIAKKEESSESSTKLEAVSNTASRAKIEEKLE